MSDAARALRRRAAARLGRLSVVQRVCLAVLAVSLAFVPLVIRIARVSRLEGPMPGWAIFDCALFTGLLLLASVLTPLGALWPCERWRRTADPALRRARLPLARSFFRRASFLIVGGQGLSWALYVWALERALETGTTGAPWVFNAADLADLGGRALASIALLPLVDWLLLALARELGHALRAEGQPAGQIGPGVTTLLLIYTTAMVLSPWLTLLQFHLRGVLDWPHLVAYFPGLLLWLALAIVGLSRFMVAPLQTTVRLVDTVIRPDGTIGSERLPPVSAAEFDRCASAVNRMLDRLVVAQGELQLRVAERDQRTLEARRALRLRDEFIDIASHELRTPLTALLLQLNWLQTKDRSLAGVADRAGRNARRLAVLVDSLLDVSRIEAGGLDLTRKPESIEALFADVLGEASGIAWGPLDVACEPGLVVELDRDRIEQVLVNLVGNARKYGPPEGTITVRARREGGDALLTVADQGPGVAVEDREVIFDRFFRAETATRSTQAGLGLGLYICKTIVERHGGRIWVEPGEGGVGARFGILLPGARPAHPEPPQPTA
jgi:signal transduction histidine kinase